MHSVCKAPVKTRRSKVGDYVYKGPTFHELRRLHQYDARADAYDLRCPVTFQLWTIGLLVVGGLLLIVAIGLLMNFLITRGRRRRAASQVSEVTSFCNCPLIRRQNGSCCQRALTGFVTWLRQNVSMGQSYMVAQYQEANKQDNVVNQGMVGIKVARIGDYTVLAARQWQLAENLSVFVWACDVLLMMFYPVLSRSIMFYGVLSCSIGVLLIFHFCRCLAAC